MDSLKQIGAVLGSHYEKIILSVILLALLGAAALLPVRVSQNRETIRRALETVERSRKKESEPIDTSTATQILRRTRTEPEIELSGSHNLFNPVLWKRGANGMPYKVVRGDEDGPGGLEVTAIRPLHFKVEYDGVQVSGDSVRYKFIVTDESSVRGRAPRPKQLYLDLGAPSKRDPFVVARINEGPPEDPVSLEIRFVGSNESAIVSREKPYNRIAGYEADLAHTKLGTKFNNVRTKQPGGLRLAGQSYNIVAITEDEVTVESSTRKRWTIHLKGAP